jgi:drug/metabolite transporter (DMT)-like permease
VVYRFALAAALLMGWALAARAPLALSPRQHAAAFGMGVATFAVQYPLVYLAETRLASAVVAVLFAALSFVNLAGFRLVYGQRAPSQAWGAALLGVLGVLVLSLGELAAADMTGRAGIGLALALAAVFASAGGNLFARDAEHAGAGVVASTAWAMAYGAAALAAASFVMGVPFGFDPRPTYVLSLLYLAVVGSVLAFLTYFALARRRGFAVAAYISALTPIVAMLVSTLFENKHWSAVALLGVVVILAGQWLLLRASKRR